MKNNNNIIFIAEAGVNHNGSLETAKELISIAKDCKADYIKFQTFKSEESITESAPKANYQIKNTKDSKESQLEMVKKLELSFKETFSLYEECKSQNIKFLSTGFDIESIQFLSKLNLDFWKIASGELTNYLNISEMIKSPKPFLLSTGMSSLSDIKKTYDFLITKKISKEDITILQCTTEYPANEENCNLAVLNEFKSFFDCNVGYSDHTLGHQSSIMAATLGAKVIEKHFTLDKNMVGPDHKASLEPNELKELISSIKKVPQLIGSNLKKVQECEEKNYTIARKSIVAKVNIKKNDIFTEENITTKRPNQGICASKFYKVIGRRATKDYVKNFKIDERI